MAHAPCALIGDAQLPLDFLSRNAVARAGHQVHGKEPLGQIGARLVEDRPSGRINVVAACLTGIGPAFAHGMELGALLAAGARDFGTAVVYFHQFGEAGSIVRIFLLELLERVFRHRPIPYAALYLRLRDSLSCLLLVVKV